MAQPEILVVDQFLGIRRGLRSGIARSARRDMNEPRDLRNAIVDENGSLWIPPAPSVLEHDFESFEPSAERVTMMVNVRRPSVAVVYQIETKVYYSAAGGATPVLLFTAASDVPLWSAEFGDDLYLGSPEETVKVSDGWNTEVLNNDNVPPGFHSYMYKGRRFVADRAGPGFSQTVWFSELNQPETFPQDNFFLVAGDTSGGSWSTDPGSIIAFTSFEDYLVIFCTQSIWLFSGTTPDTFYLRRTDSIAGAFARDSIVRIEGGILFFGGTPRGELGVYVFTGTMSELVSQNVSAFFRRWGQISFEFTDATRYFHAVRWNDNYVFSAETIRTDDMSAGDGREVFTYNFVTNSWSTFDGWLTGPRIAMARRGGDRLFISQDLKVRSTFEAMARAPGQRARFLLGWNDNQHTAGHHRFMAVKVGGWQMNQGETETKLTLKAKTPDTAQEVVIERLIGSSVWDNLIFPLNLRGNAIDLDFEIEFGTDNAQALIEQVQLIKSSKGEKLSRA